jgi:uncharacterized protein
MESNSRQKEVVFQTKEYVEQYFKDESSGHDWWHIFRVHKLALKISKVEGGDLFLVEMAALLHDLDDWKLVNKNDDSKITAWLRKVKIPEEEARKIVAIIEQVSFKGAGVEARAISIEAQIVQDADRLDAIGAIGIARTFAYGGNKGRLLYHPDVKPEMHTSFEAYKKTTAPTINHFYEKLLLLKDRLNTATALKIAEHRHEFMEEFLQEFFNEWECNF